VNLANRTIAHSHEWLNEIDRIDTVDRNWGLVSELNAERVVVFNYCTTSKVRFMPDGEITQERDSNAMFCTIADAMRQIKSVVDIN
jgi:hypothetical protein